jgi:hypothetical protein
MPGVYLQIPSGADATLRPARLDSLPSDYVTATASRDAQAANDVRQCVATATDTAQGGHRVRIGSFGRLRHGISKASRKPPGFSRGELSLVPHIDPYALSQTFFIARAVTDCAYDEQSD